MGIRPSLGVMTMSTTSLLGRLRPALGLGAAALAACLSLAALPAAAATCNPANVTTDPGIAASACLQANPLGPGGNTTLHQMNSQTIFGFGDANPDGQRWTIADKIDVGGSLLGSFFSITVTETKGGAALGGTWSLLPGLVFAPGESYAMVLKGTTSSFVYLLDTSSTFGTWSTADLRTGPQGRNQAGLSNITLMGTAAPIPLPAAAWLLLGGIAGLGAVARRRRLAARPA